MAFVFCNATNSSHVAGPPVWVLHVSVCILAPVSPVVLSGVGLEVTGPVAVALITIGTPPKTFVGAAVDATGKICISPTGSVAPVSAFPVHSSADLHLVSTAAWPPYGPVIVTHGFAVTVAAASAVGYKWVETSLRPLLTITTGNSTGVFSGGPTSI